MASRTLCFYLPIETSKKPPQDAVRNPDLYGFSNTKIIMFYMYHDEIFHSSSNILKEPIIFSIKVETDFESSLSTDNEHTLTENYFVFMILAI